MEKIPVHIITGFLGAGKTTFLNQLMRGRQPERMMVIENEVGKTNIDSKLVIGSDFEVLELTAGCLCCSLNDSFLDLLEEVSASREDFDRLLIETTGVADPESLALPFLASAAVERVFELVNVICLVDAAHIEEWLKETEESRRQISFADVILLNKSDLVSPERLAELQQLVADINPYAHVFVGQNGEFPVDEILAIQQIDDAGAVKKAQSIPLQHHHHNHGISTFTLTFDQPFDLNRLGHELVKLLNVNRHQIYRIKGIINGNDYPVQIVLQSVLNTFRLSDGLPWEAGQPKISKVVVIGKNLQKEAVHKIFNRHLVR